MKFLILASLFVLSVVAEPEAQHFTAGFVQHYNGAVVPQDTESVKAAKFQHLSAKNTAYFNAAPKQVVYSNVPAKVPALPLRHYLTKKVQVQTPAHTYAINPFYHVYQPTVYGYPTVHHSLGKREAEAEPEADAQYYYNTYPGYTGYSAYTAGYPYTTGYTGYPYTTGYTYSPYFNNFYNRRVFKREAEAEAEPEADAQYFNYYNTFSGYTPYTAGYPYTTGYTGYPYTTGYTYSPYFNNYYNRRVFKREAEAEAEPEADAQYLNYYNTFSGYTPYTTGFRYPYTTYAQTPYTYRPYNYNFNTFNGFYRY